MNSITFLESGFCVHPGFVALRGGGLATRKFPAMVAVLEHPRHGIILFDTGYSEKFISETESFPYRLYRWITPVTIDPATTARHKLTQLGISPADVRTIIISHFHGDHIGGLWDFPQAQFVYVPHAFEDVRHRKGFSALLAGYLPGLLPTDFLSRSRVLEPASKRPLPPEFSPFQVGYDVFGDETLWAVELPGHAVGQIGLFARDSSGKAVFLVADACWASEAFLELRLPHPVTKILFADSATYRNTVRQIREFHELHPETAIIPCHCMKAVEAFRQVGTSLSQKNYSYNEPQ
ncbi:MAG: MBL fold metallo-hydrolase [Blastocatellia bacterium]|nr:MBL fold metallo-hydrolase [Blastocatellia bacterium]